MSLRTGLILGAGLVAAVAMAASAATLAGLGAAVGWTSPLHWSLPVAVDVLALVAGVAWLAAGVPDAARTLGRTLTLVSVLVSVVLNAISHLVTTGHMTAGPWLVIAVSAVPPLAAALAVHLTAAITTAVDTAEPLPVSTPAPEQVDTVPEPAPDEVDTPAVEPAVSTQTVQVTEPEPLRVVESHPEVDTPAARLSTPDAKAAIEAAWTEGLTVREAADRATRAPSYVGQQYARLTRERGHQPSKGQTVIQEVAA